MDAASISRVFVIDSSHLSKSCVRIVLQVACYCSLELKAKSGRSRGPRCTPSEKSRVSSKSIRRWKYHTPQLLRIVYITVVGIKVNKNSENRSHYVCSSFQTISCSTDWVNTVMPMDPTYGYGCSQKKGQNI